MIIYRYEKADGGGPWFNFDGYLRNNTSIQDDIGYLYGCTSLKKLNEYFEDHKNEVNLKDCHLIIYNVPDEEVIVSKREVLFPKKYGRMRPC